MVRLAAPSTWRALVASLKARFEALVADVGSTGGVLTAGSRYIGRNQRFGDTRFGNRACEARAAPGTSRMQLRLIWQAAVDAYGAWILRPEQRGMRETIRAELRGQRVACHCVGRGLPCHGHWVVIIANCSECELQRLIDEAPTAKATAAARRATSAACRPASRTCGTVDPAPPELSATVSLFT